MKSKERLERAVKLPSSHESYCLWHSDKDEGSLSWRSQKRKFIFFLNKKGGKETLVWLVEKLSDLPAWAGSGG